MVHELKGIGENYHDHPVVFMTFEGPKESKEDWVIPRFRLIIKKNPLYDCANFHINMRPPTEVAGIKRMMPISAHLLNSETGDGFICKAKIPMSCRESIPACWNILKISKRWSRRCILSMSWCTRDRRENFTDRSFNREPADDWGKFARSTYDSYHHGVGTCKMGPASDNMAVVDEKLRVHGMSNLWVGDASIMPVVSHANTNLTSIMIGERLSDFVKEVA